MKKKKWIGWTRGKRRLKNKIKNGNIKDLTISQRNSFYLNELRKKPTRAELVFGDFLESMGIRFIFQKGFFIPFHRILDFYLPDKNIGFEIDGSSHWHKRDLDRKKDNDYLKIRGIKVYRIENDDVFSGEFVKIVENVLKVKIIAPQKKYDDWYDYRLRVAIEKQNDETEFNRRRLERRELKLIGAKQ